MPEIESVSVEERIIAAAITCIEQYGLQGATNRKIAKIAGVNSAAINYYFRSKDALIERCMQASLSSLYHWEASAGLPASTSAEYSTEYFDQFIQAACRLPGVTRALFYDLFSTGRPNSPAVTRLNQSLVQLTQDLRAKGAGMEEEELHLAAAQVAAAVLLVALAPRLFEEGFGLDLNDPDMRQVFVHRLVERLL